MLSASLSPFGRLVELHLRNRGLAKADLAKAAGIKDRTAITRILRKKGNDPKAYSPSLEFLLPWADLLQLHGEERRIFIAMGIFDRCQPATAQRLSAELGLPEIPHPIAD